MTTTVTFSFSTIYYALQKPGKTNRYYENQLLCGGIRACNFFAEHLVIYLK